MDARPTTGLRLVPLSQETLAALLDGDLDTASRSAGIPLTPYFLGEGWLWRIRLEQVRRDASAGPWIARAAVSDADGVVGHVGFHGPPGADGMVEVAYSVDPALRRRGYASAMLRLALDRAAADPAVRTVRASISPDNAASLAAIAPFGFTQVGDQWDDEDGLELVFERSAESPHEKETV